jgi:hypothetical protein
MTSTWFETEAKRIEKEDKERLKEMGYKEALVLEQGTTVVTLNVKDAPKKVKTQYGEKFVLECIDPKDKAVMCSEYLYGLIVDELMTNKGNGKLKITRIGEGKATRYSVQTAE